MKVGTSLDSLWHAWRHGLEKTAMSRGSETPTGCLPCPTRVSPFSALPCDLCIELAFLGNLETLFCRALLSRVFSRLSKAKPAL